MLTQKKPEDRKPRLQGQDLMNAVDQLLQDFYDTTRAWRAANPDKEPPAGWPPIPFDYPTQEAWQIAHNEWRARAGLPQKKFPKARGVRRGLLRKKTARREESER